MIDKDHRWQPVLSEKKSTFIQIFILFGLILGGYSSACSPTGTTEGKVVTSTPKPEKVITPTPTDNLIPDGHIAYEAQSGDTIPAVAAHFGVNAESIITLADIENHEKLNENACEDGATGDNSEAETTSGCIVSGVILDPGTVLFVKDVLKTTTRNEILFPDSEVVFSPSVIGFDLAAFAAEQGGYLNEYAELMQAGLVPAVVKIWELAEVYSINPRLLVSIIEQESGWVTGFPVTDEEKRYPLGFIHPDRGGILPQVGWTIRFLNDGYYGWRAGTLTELTFTDGETLRLSPHLNAGTVAVMYSMAQIHTYDDWQDVLYGPENLVDTHTDLFGDTSLRVVDAEPLFPEGITQPKLNLPFSPDEKWNLTSGPHPAWGRHGALAALDFSPPLSKPGCGVSHHWTTAAGAGLIVRGVNGSAVIDLDGDGFEQTGWVLVYMHLGNTERLGVGDWVEVDDPIGHPSCVGGSSTGIHVHIARKFNGEWVLADGGLPFVLSGYRAYNGDEPYEGTLVRGSTTVIANAFGNYWTKMMRPDSDPKFFYTPTPKP
jgi:LasA protease